jgi:competence protein ComEA
MAGAVMAQAPMVARKPLDLNTASAEELVALIGISEMIAESIVDFRDANGGFHSVEELLEIEGINSGWYQRIRLMVTV